MFEQNQPTMGRTKMKIPLGKLTWDCLYLEPVPKVAVVIVLSRGAFMILGIAGSYSHRENRKNHFF